MTDTETPDILNVEPNPPPPEASRREGDTLEIYHFLGKTEFEAMLLALRVMTATDKRKMREAIENKKNPAEFELVGLYTVYRHATEEEKKLMLEAIATPPPEKPPYPDSITPQTLEDQRAALIVFRLMAKKIREHIAAALDTGLDTLTKEEFYMYGQFVALATCTDGEIDGDLAEIFDISKEKVAELRARELATPPEQYDFFRDPVTQKKEEARRKLRRSFAMSQTSGYNALMAINPKNAEMGVTERTETKENTPPVDMLSVSLTKRNRRGSATLTIERRKEENALIEAQCEAAAARWRTSAKKMLDYAVIKLTEKNPHIKRGTLVDIREIDTLVSWTLEDWCRLRGRPLTEASLDHERARGKEDCDTLVGTHFAWTEKGRRGAKAYKFLNPLQYAEIKNNVISIRLSQDFSRVLLEAPIMHYRRKMLSTDERNPNAYAIARKLGDFANIKDTSDRRKKIPIENQYKISVSALIDCTSIPNPEKVPNYNYRILIVNPFLLAMEEAERVLDIEWGFVSDIEEAQIVDKTPPKKIESFMSAYIVYSFKDVDKMQDATE